MSDIISRPWGYGIGQGGITLGFASPSGVLTIDSYFLSVLLEFGMSGIFRVLRNVCGRFGTGNVGRDGTPDR